MSSDKFQEEMLRVLPRLRGYATALTGNRFAAEDLIQDTVERAWSKSDRWREDRDIQMWLHTIMHNLYVDQLRQKTPPVLSLDESTGHEVPANGELPDEVLNMRDIDNALQQLPWQQREVLLLISLQDLSYEQAAYVLEIPIGTVMSRLSRAREKLRLLIEPPTLLRAVK
jgi:RNA polymerase sigma-70 factor (ECF subfamily)